MHIRHMHKRTMDITRSITPTSVSLSLVSAKRNEHFASPETVGVALLNDRFFSLVISTLQCLISDTFADFISPRAIFVITFLSIWITSLVNGSVKTLSSFWSVFLLSLRSRTLIIRPVKPFKYPLITSNGRKTSTESQLKLSWTTAPAKARRNSFRSAAWAKETMVLVTEVPMFAPITM